MTSFAPLFELSDSELAAQNIHRCIVDEKPGYPCRVSLVDVEIGETVLLIPFVHQPAKGPYRSSGPIYVRDNTQAADLQIDEVPYMLSHRLLSVRGYDAEDVMIGANVVHGTELEGIIRQMLADRDIAYLHIHNAGQGCFNCRVDRV